MAILPVYSVVEEGAEASVAARAFGRKMIEQIAESQLRVNKLYRQLADGTVLIAQRAGQQYRLTILSRSRASTQAQQVAQVWSPRGFVVWPVSDAAPFGWGFPVVQDTGFNVTAYSKQNLAPGLDVARWTAAGPLPEVLLSRVTDAGYPKRKKNIAPMNFSTSHGPQPQRPPGGKRVDVQADQARGEMVAYRPEFDGLVDEAHERLAGARRQGFELVNAHRAGLGRDPLNLPLRGFYSAAQTLCDMSAATSLWGHFNAAYWRTFKAPGDRASKDGVPNFQDASDAASRDHYQWISENYTVAAISFTTTGTDPNGDPYGEMGGAQPMSAQSAFTAWLNSPPHRANIEDVRWNGRDSFVDIGSNGAWAQDFSKRDQWIGCGNACWFSEHAEIPPLSWHAPPTMNLALDTWQVEPDFGDLSYYHVVHIPAWTQAAGQITVDAVDVYPFDVVPSDVTTIADLAQISVVPNLATDNGKIVDSTGQFSQHQYTTNDPLDYDYGRVRPVLQSGIYLRGRCIGIAPRGALVLGAGIERFQQSKVSASINGRSEFCYRLKIIVHDQADQPADAIADGMMSVVHLYHCDLDDLNGFAAHAGSTIKGIRGATPVEPWLDTDDVWAWIDDGTIAVNSTGAGSDLLRYQSLWRFNPAGTQACCLREQNTLAQVKEYIYRTLPFPQYLVTGHSAGQVTIQVNGFAGGGGRNIPNYGWIATTHFGGPNRTLLLTWPNTYPPPFANETYVPELSIEPVPPICAVQQLHDSPLPFPEGIVIDRTTGGAAEPTVPGCKMSGNHIAVDYDALGNRVYIGRIDLELRNIQALAMSLVTFKPKMTVLGRGTFAAAAPAQFDALVNPNDWFPFNRSVMFGVVDVLDFAVVLPTFDSYEPGQNGGGSFEFTPTGNCWTSTVFAEAWRAGDKLNRVEAANIGAFNEPMLRCDAESMFATYQTLNANYGTVQPSYAKARNGDWMLSWAMCPQPTSIVFNGVGGCAGNPSYNHPDDPPPCFPTTAQLAAAGSLSVPQVRSLGGWMTSSFGDQTQLADMMKIPGSHPRCFYVRAV